MDLTTQSAVAHFKERVAQLESELQAAKLRHDHMKHELEEVSITCRALVRLLAESGAVDEARLAELSAGLRAEEAVAEASERKIVKHRPYRLG